WGRPLEKHLIQRKMPSATEGGLSRGLSRRYGVSCCDGVSWSLCCGAYVFAFAGVLVTSCNVCVGTWLVFQHGFFIASCPTPARILGRGVKRIWKEEGCSLLVGVISDSHGNRKRILEALHYLDGVDHIL